MPAIAIVASQWHAEIVEQAVTGFTDRLAEQDLTDVDVFRVPGAFEIPLHVRKLAETGRYAAIAATGLVVDGGIYRHDFVASAVIDGLMRVQLDTEVPVFSAVLTPHHFHDHEEHRTYFHRHFVVKGTELADAVTGTLASLSTIEAAHAHE